MDVIFPSRYERVSPMPSPSRPTYRPSTPAWTGPNDEVRFTGHLRRTADYSKDFLKVPAYPEYMNELGHVEAGHVMKLIDIGGSIPPKRHLGENNLVVTASLDRTNFTQPIHRWELIQLESRLTRAWNTSMESQVKVSAWNFHTNEVRPIATAYLVFVALDARRNKAKVPALVPVNFEDFQLARAADLRKNIRQQEGRDLPAIPIDLNSDNPVVVERPMTENDSNAMNNVFGGVILGIMEEAGRQAAKRQALGATVVGVRMDRMSFLEPAYIGETIQAKAIVTKTWNTSMEVQVEVEALNPSTQKVRRIAQAYLVYVGLGPDGAKVSVPPFHPATELQEKRATSADVRRKNRKDETLEMQKSLERPVSWWQRAKWQVISWYYQVFQPRVDA